MRDPTERYDDPFPVHEQTKDIGHFLRYEHERPDVVAASCDWQGEVSAKTVDTVLAILQGDYPEDVFLAELPRASGWTRKLKLFFPDQEGHIVNVIGGGAPRLLLGGDVVYQLPISRAKRQASLCRYFMDDGRLLEEVLTFDEVQGGLSLPAAEHIHNRMLRASALISSPVAVPSLVARGHFKIPHWDGAFLVYSEVLSRRPRYYLRPENRRRKFNGTLGVDVFCSGVRSLFQVLRQINQHHDGLFHGDLVHRIRGGSANVGFTPDGQAVIKGWGWRIDEHASDWPSTDRRRHQMQEVVGALAGLIQDIDLSEISRQEQQRLLVDVVAIGLEEYTERQGKLDRVSMASGLPSDVDRFTKSTQVFLSGSDASDNLVSSTLYQEAGPLQNGIKRWLVDCVTRYL